MNTRAPRARTASRATRVIAATTLAIALVACSNDQQLADITTIAPPITQPATTAGPATTATEATEPAVDTTVEATVPETTATPSTVASDPGVTGPMFSEELGVKVATAPGVNTPGDTRQLLPEGLYVHIAWQADPNDPSVFTVRAEDIEILEAYANAATAYYRVAGTTLDTSDAELMANYVDPKDMFGRSFEQARVGGYVLKIGSGVVLRPYVVDRTDTTATVYDCFLEDSSYVVTDEEIGASEPVADGQVLTLVLQDGRWIVDTAGVLERACS